MITVLISMSYFILIMFARDWVLKRLMLIIVIASILFVLGILDTFSLKIYYPESIALFDPLISLIIYLILYKFYNKKYKKKLMIPVEALYEYDSNTFYTMAFIAFSMTFSAISLGLIHDLR